MNTPVSFKDSLRNMFLGEDFKFDPRNSVCLTGRGPAWSLENAHSVSSAISHTTQQLNAMDLEVGFLRSRSLSRTSPSSQSRSISGERIFAGPRESPLSRETTISALQINKEDAGRLDFGDHIRITVQDADVMYKLIYLLLIE